MQGMRIKSHKGYFHPLPAHLNHRTPWAPKPFSAVEAAPTPVKAKAVTLVPRPAAAKAKSETKKRVAGKAAAKPRTRK